MSESPVIVAEGLGKRFGSVVALDGVDLCVGAGRVFGLLGPNGAGKTTTVRILSTLLRPDAGRAVVGGLDVEEHPGAVRRIIGVSGQYAAVDPYLTGRENLRMIGRLAGLGWAAAGRRAEELLAAFDLVQAGERSVRGYSGGMRRRLDVAASLVAAPRVLFLDEPTTGLDPRSRLAVWQLLADLKAAGTSVLLTTQYLEEADRFADELAVIDAGRVIAHGTPEQLKSRLGGDCLELRPAARTDVDRLIATVNDLASAAPLRQPDDTVVVPVPNGADVLVPLAQRLAAADITLAGLAVRRPTLDDVFLALTGHDTTAPDADVAEPNMPKRARPPEPIPDDAPADGREAGSHAIRDVAVVTGRNLLRLLRVPTLAVFATVQPVLLVLLFTYAFGGAVHAPGVRHYIDYLLPGLFVLAIGFGASQTGVAIAEDLSSGMLDRFRSLPIAGSAVLVGRMIADAARNLFVVALMIGIAALLGFRFHAGAPAALAAVGLAVAIGLTFSWVNLLLGLAVRDPESAGLAGLFPVIILVFTSSTLVPVTTMPGWLQAFAAHQPITATVDALRALCLGGPTNGHVLQALVWTTALLAAAVPLAVTRYRRNGAA